MRHRFMYPKPRGPDGKPVKCGQRTEEGEVCAHCGSSASTCQKRGVYPDKRCALHTEWLSGDAGQRKAADDWRGQDPRETARARAWRVYLEHMSSK